MCFVVHAETRSLCFARYATHTEFKAIGRLLDEEDELGAIYAELLGMVRCVQSTFSGFC